MGAEGQIILGHAQEHITRIQHTNTFKTVSTLRFNPLQPMVVTCTAHSEAFPEVVRETENPLNIEDFTSEYDNSVVKCLQEKVNGEVRILKQFRLTLDTSTRKPPALQADDGMAYDQPPTTKKPEKPA